MAFDIAENRLIWSDEVAEIHEMPPGYTPNVDDGIGFYAPEYRERITEVFARCVEAGEPYDEKMQIITGTGRRVWVRTIGEAVRNGEGKIVKVQGGFQDISEQKMAEEALRRSEAQFRALVEGAPDAIYVHIDGRFVYLNETALRMYGAKSPRRYWEGASSNCSTHPCTMLSGRDSTR
jgi:PAS domain-containing protein